MKYRPLKRVRRNKINLRKIENFDLYFEKIPLKNVYKIQRAIGQNLRKLKNA